MQKNDDVSTNLSVNMGQRRRAEDELLRLKQEYEDFKQRARDDQANDGREIVTLQNKVKDLQSRLDSSENEKRHSLEQLAVAHQQNQELQNELDRMQGAAMSDKAAIEELEIKNRLLVDKLNNQIYMQASMYKEKTLEVLNRGHSNNTGGGRMEHSSTSPLRKF